MEDQQFDKERRMLQFLYRALVEAWEQGEAELLLKYVEVPHVGLKVYKTGVDITQELGLNGAEAVDLLKDLSIDGYIRFDYGHGGWAYADINIIGLAFTEKGLAAIEEELPGPNTDLLERLDAATEKIKELGGVPADKKKPAIEAVEELKHFVRALPPEIAVEFSKGLFGAFADR